jgi:hypothetical protein
MKYINITVVDKQMKYISITVVDKQMKYINITVVLGQKLLQRKRLILIFLIISFINMLNYSCTIKLDNVVTFIKQSPVLKGHLFLVLS